MRKEGLQPITDDMRSIPLWSYILFWWSSLIVVQAFAVGFFGVYPVGPLNVTQALVAAALGSLLLALLWSLNAFPGYEKGVPYASQAVSSFGVHGAKIATVLRSLPAIAWLGIGNWIGAVAIDTITQTLWGFGNTGVYFVLFLLLQVFLAIKGVAVMKWFNTTAAIVVSIILVHSLVEILRKGDPIVESASYLHPGSWGIEFWGVVAAVVAAVLTGALNSSDVSRHLVRSEGDRNNWVGHMMGVLPPWLFMLALGIIFAISAGTPDPVQALMALSPGAVTGVILLVFVLGAQISTNLSLNFLPPTHAMQDMTFKITWEIGIIISALLSVATFPWLLFTSDHFYTFLGVYALFLGPVLGITLADYWVVNRRNMDVNALYAKGEGSMYWYYKGFSMAAVLSLLVGAVASLFFMRISWMVGLPIAFVLYIVFRSTVERAPHGGVHVGGVRPGVAAGSEMVKE